MGTTHFSWPLAKSAQASIHRKSLSLKISSHQEKISESSCENEKDDGHKYKKLVFQKSQRMGKGNNSIKNRFKSDSSKSNKFLVTP